MKQIIQLTVNGLDYELDIDPRSTLLDVLRNQLSLKSVRRSCGEGECGACTVLLDGEPVNSCLLLAAEAEGQIIITSEGLIKNDTIHPIMQSFIDNYGFQCGYCISGIIMTSYALLNHYQNVNENVIKEYISGHLCRCTGYVNIIKSIQEAQKKKNDGNWW